MKVMIIMLLLAWCVVSCGSRVTTIDPVFEKEQRLEAEAIPVNQLLAPDFMVEKNGFLFVASSKADTMIQIYALPSLSYAGGMGRKGRGPDEFYAFPMFCSADSKEYIYIWGTTPNIIKKGRVTGSGSVEYVKDLVVKSVDNLNNMHIMQDSILTYFLPTSLTVKQYDLVNNQEKICLQLPAENHREPSYYANRGTLAGNDSLMLYVYLFKKQIDMYDVKTGGLIWRISDNKHYAVPEVGADFADWKFQYTNVVMGEKFFYAVSPRSVTSKIAEQGLSVEVFDYNGGPVIRYSFDISPTCMVVDERNGYIYGYNYQYPESLLRYKLPAMSEK